MDSELNEDGKQDIEVEDVSEWSFSRELLNGLRQMVSLQNSSERDSLTLAREMHRKHTDIRIPVIVI